MVIYNCVKKDKLQQVILNVSHIFLAKIKVWSKLRKNFYLLINFSILQQRIIYPILSSKVFIFLIWTRQTFACSKSTIRHGLKYVHS